MKTNLIANPPVTQNTQQKPATRLSAFVGLLVAVFCAALVSFTSSPVALAGGADGEYLLTSISGTITMAGETEEIPQDLVQQFANLQSGGIVVKNNKINIDRKIAVRLINKLAKEYGADVDYDLSGPTSLKLNKHGKIFTGSTSKPVEVSFKISHPSIDQVIKGSLKTDFDARVKGKVLTLHVPITGKIIGQKVSANLTVVCTR